MSGRILQMQRQVRELGRLRTGYTTGNRPVRSKTWILTSKDRNLLDAAAAEWGGQVVEWTPLNSDVKQWSLTTDASALPAFLPPGDPLTQNYEMWNRGGATRRCDGATESKSGKPCLCRAQFGDTFYTRDIREVCKPYSQLNVMLLGLPDIGVWRHVTKSFYAAGEIAGMVDLIKAKVGPQPIVPVWLVIDQREKVADGKRTPYPVPIIKIRGAESGAALLAGEVPTLELGRAPERPALESAGSQTPALPANESKPPLTVDDAMKQIGMARNQKQLDMLKDDFSAAGLRDQRVIDAWMARSKELAAAKPTSAPPAHATDVVEGEPEPDRAALMMQILALAGGKPYRWSSADLERRVHDRFGVAPDDIDGWQAQTFLDELKNGQVS